MAAAVVDANSAEAAHGEEPSTRTDRRGQCGRRQCGVVACSHSTADGAPLPKDDAEETGPWKEEGDQEVEAEDDGSGGGGVVSGASDPSSESES